MTISGEVGGDDPLYLDDLQLGPYPPLSEMTYSPTALYSRMAIAATNKRTLNPRCRSWA